MLSFMSRGQIQSIACLSAAAAVAPRAACYTHTRQSGDKYDGWAWLGRITHKPVLKAVA